MSRANTLLRLALIGGLAAAAAGCFNLEGTETELPSELRGLGGAGAAGEASGGAAGSAGAAAGNGGAAAGNGGAAAGNGAGGAGASGAVGGAAGSSGCEACGPLQCNSALGHCDAERVAQEGALVVAAGQEGVIWLRGFLATPGPVRWLPTGASSAVDLDTYYTFSPRSGALVTPNNVYWGSTSRGVTRASLPAPSSLAMVVSGESSVVGRSERHVVVINGDSQKNALWRVELDTGFATSTLCIPPGYYWGGAVDPDGTIWAAVDDTLYWVPSSAPFTAACSAPGSVSSVLAGASTRAVAGEAGRLVLVQQAGSQVVELDRTSFAITRSFGSALQNSRALTPATPLAAAAGFVYFFEPQLISGLAHLIAVDSAGTQRSVALVPGLPIALSASSTHIYIASDVGVYRAPL